MQTGNLNLTLYIFKFRIAWLSYLVKSVIDLSNAPVTPIPAGAVERVGGRRLQRWYCEQKRSEVKKKSSFVS